MYKISINKELFEDIKYKKINILKKDTTLYWKKELLKPIIENDKIKYSIKQVDKLLLTNGLGEEKPQLIVECLKVDYSFKNDIFEFHLGKIVAQKNTDENGNYKDDLIKQLIREKATLEDSVNKDYLTQVYNRRKMENDLKMFINQQNSSFLNAVLIDIDKFKNINDNFGYDIGDKTLVYLAQKLSKHAKILNGDVYRYRNAEFIILCFIDKTLLLGKLHNLRTDIKSQKIHHPKRDIFITISIGVAFYNECSSYGEMLKKADIALCRAREKSGDTIELTFA